MTSDSLDPLNPITRPVVFLDRDGTINVDHGYTYRREEWEFIEGAPEAICRLKEAGFAIAVITNQSGIARDYYTLTQMETLHQYIQKRLADQGAEIDALAYCPHGPQENCACRKPRTGMAAQIETSLDCEIDYAASWTIGDKPADIGFGLALGTKTILLRSRYWSPEQLETKPDHIANSLSEAVAYLLETAPK